MVCISRLIQRTLWLIPKLRRMILFWKNSLMRIIMKINEKLRRQLPIYHCLELLYFTTDCQIKYFLSQLNTVFWLLEFHFEELCCEMFLQRQGLKVTNMLNCLGCNFSGDRGQRRCWSGLCVCWDIWEASRWNEQWWVGCF